MSFFISPKPFNCSPSTKLNNLIDFETQKILVFFNTQDVVEKFAVNPIDTHKWV
jgi:hypothetical protein